MKRFSAAPLFVQALALVAATATAAQLITFAVLLVIPTPREVFTFGDVAAAIRSTASLKREGQTLFVDREDAAPRGWEKDDGTELRARLTLAALLGVAPAQVRIEHDIPLPGGASLLRLISSMRAGSSQRPRPLEGGGAARFYDLAAAARLPDGRWAVVNTIHPWPGPGTFLVVWLAANILILVPLAWLFTRRLVEPIRAFAATAEAAGRGDRNATFPTAGPREVRKAARALAEMQLRIGAAVEERTNLIAAIAHDLRAPLTRLRFKAENISPEHRASIVNDIHRMDAMIGGVLAFARGEERVSRQRLELETLVQSVVDDFAETGADVTLVEVAPLEVKGDSLALRRLIGNILDNAVRYGGGAQCRVRAERNRALLLVEDAGPGLPENSLERMFTPFVRGDDARDPATGGVGLGLALARAIARAHGGDVWLTRRPERGLCAHVELPIASEDGAVTNFS